MKSKRTHFKAFHLIFFIFSFGISNVLFWFFLFFFFFFHWSKWWPSVMDSPVTMQVFNNNNNNNNDDDNGRTYPILVKIVLCCFCLFAILARSSVHFAMPSVIDFQLKAKFIQKNHADDFQISMNKSTTIALVIAAQWDCVTIA